MAHCKAIVGVRERMYPMYRARRTLSGRNGMYIVSQKVRCSKDTSPRCHRGDRETTGTKKPRGQQATPPESGSAPAQGPLPLYPFTDIRAKGLFSGTINQEKESTRCELRLLKNTKKKVNKYLNKELNSTHNHSHVSHDNIQTPTLCLRKKEKEKQ